MPTISENLHQWGSVHDWQYGGEEWSAAWGGAHRQWFSTILPRIRASTTFPVDTILEIGCGYGRWSKFLRPFARRLILVDVVPKCVEASRHAFAEDVGVACYVNDGRRLEKIEDDSVDFVFSFDSLVHADISVMEAYLTEISRILTPRGAAFLHHSNLGDYPRAATLARYQPWCKLLKAFQIIERSHNWRDASVSAIGIRTLADRHGLACKSQELVPWNTSKRTLLDCFSTIVKPGNRATPPCRVFANPQFMSEAASAKNEY